MFPYGWYSTSVTNLANAGYFVDRYFETVKLDPDNRETYGYLKQTIIETAP